MTMNLSWQELYRVALLEVQPDELRRRIGAAEKAIGQRIEELKQAGSQSSEEQQAMADALRTLRVLAQTGANPNLRQGPADLKTRWHRESLLLFANQTVPQLARFVTG
jgi:hypothetical protein